MRKTLLTILLIMLNTSAFALSDGYKNALKHEIHFLLYSHLAVPYTWGGYTNPTKGLDCSGFLTYVALRAGLPVRRTVAAEMAMGLKGWSGKNIDLDDIEEYDIPFFTWKDSTRIFGHVGILIEGNNGLIGLAHASSSKKKLVHQQYTGTFIRDTARIRRLSHGDKTSPLLGKGIKQTK